MAGVHRKLAGVHWQVAGVHTRLGARPRNVLRCQRRFLHRGVTARCVCSVVEGRRLPRIIKPTPLKDGNLNTQHKQKDWSCSEYMQQVAISLISRP